MSPATWTAALLAVLQASVASSDPETVLARAGLLGLEARAVEIDADGALWVGFPERGLVRVAGGTHRVFTEEDGLMSTGIADLQEDGAGRLWAVGLAGAAVDEGSGWTARGRLAGLEPRVVFRARPGPGGEGVWLATSAGALRGDGRGGWSALTGDDGLPHAVVHDVAVDDEGTAWAACRRGLARIRGDRVVEETLFLDLNVRTAVVDGGGTVWIGTSDGVRVRRGGGWAAGLRGRTVQVLLPEPGGGLWAGTASSGLFRWDGHRWMAVALPDRVEGAEIFDLARGAGGVLWVATAAGVARVAAPAP